MFWIPEPIWTNQTVFIIGGGPSVNKTDLSLIYDRKVIGVNTAFKLGDWVDIGWFGDKKWIDWNEKEFKEFKGIKASCNTNNVVLKKYDWIKYVKRGKPLGIDTTKGFVSWNKSSGNSAINLAYHLGSRRIVLIGFDLKDDEKGNHNYHDEHKVKENPPYTRMISCLKVVSEDANKLGVEILNASPKSGCLFFPRGELKDFIGE